ncbi:MAG: DUF1214 domain-containing protein [Treponema sp.]|nr:DUF1214 domain-containing protein [Treponema sp.]
MKKPDNRQTPDKTPASDPVPAGRGQVLSRIRYIFDAVLGIGAGCVLAAIAATLIIVIDIGHRATTSNGWFALLNFAQPNESFLVRASDAYLLPGAAPPQEGVYWQTVNDSSRQPLNGQNNYTIHFPPGGLPPNSAFWSLTITNPKGVMVANAVEKYSVSDRSGLMQNSDGSVDIYIQKLAPDGHESNWLPAPDTGFKLWLRVYQPDDSVLSGKYNVPPVLKVN